MHIDLGKMRDKYDEPQMVEPKKPRKQEKYYPSSYMDDIGDIPVDDLPIDKDINVHMVIRIKSAERKQRKDKKGTRTSVDLNYETRSIDFNPSDKKKKDHKAADGDSIHAAILEALD